MGSGAATPKRSYFREPPTKVRSPECSKRVRRDVEASDGRIELSINEAKFPREDEGENPEARKQLGGRGHLGRTCIIKSDTFPIAPDCR